MTVNELAISCRVISDGLSDFLINPAQGYTIVRGGLAPGSRSWRRQTVQSPFVHGRTLVGRTLDVATTVLAVRVRGSSLVQVAARIAAIRGVFERTAYELEVVIDGVTMRWACEGADVVPGDSGVFDDNGLRGRYQLLTFTIPRHPIPLEGPL